jgi:DNA-binding transcriptional ArsR family regulator
MYQRVYAILADAGENELGEFIAGRIAMLDKRKAAPRKPTKEQIENEALKANILTMLDVGDLTATDIGAELGVTVQKATALLTQLRKAELVKRYQDGKDVYFGPVQ